LGKVLLKNIFAAGELSEEAVISILETTASDGKKQQISPVSCPHFVQSRIYFLQLIYGLVCLGCFFSGL
jgi:hypothetical protein